MSSSTEAAYSFTAKIGPTNDLFTVRGGDFAEFAQNLSLAADNIANIVERTAAIQAAGHAAPLVNVDVPAAQPVRQPEPQQQWQPPAAPQWSAPAQQQAPAPQWGAPAAPQWQQPQAPQPSNGGGPMCKHGLPARLVPAGTSKKTGKPYRAFYVCPNDQNSQCDFRLTV